MTPMRHAILATLLLAAAFGRTAPALAEADAAASAESAAAAVVEDFHRALAEGYRDGVIKLMDERAVVFETGFVEASREQYAAGHLDADLLFSAQVRREVVHRTVTVTGDTALVLTQSRSDGEFEGQKVHLENTETMVLRRLDDQWRIVHIHWSGHDRKPESS